MKEFLFRAKSGQTWYYGGVYRKKVYDDRVGYPDYVWHWYIVTDDGDEYRISPDTICQYTGLRDKNDTKIFKGDIVKTDNIITPLGTDTFTIEFVEGNYYICNDGAVATLRSWYEYVEVVGNIYDNPKKINRRF